MWVDWDGMGLGLGWDGSPGGRRYRAPYGANKACGLNITCSVQGSADISYIPFGGFTFCVLCPIARVGCLQYKVSKTFLAEDQHPRMYVQYIWYFAKPGDDNVRMGVSGDGRALVTPHAGSVKCDSLTHFRNCNQFFSLKILHPFSICIFWFKLIL